MRNKAILLVLTALALFYVSCSKAGNPAQPPPPDITETATPDGGKWETALNIEETPQPSYGRVLVFDKQLILTAGKDAFSTTDGLSWVTATAENCPNERSAAVSAAGKFYLFGGAVNDGKSRACTSLDKVYSSPVSFTAASETKTAAFEPREGLSAAFFNGKFIITGGTDGKTAFNDCYSRDMAGKWEKVKLPEEDSYGARHGHAMAAFRGKLFITGGEKDGKNTGEVWSSENGADWEMLTDNAAFGPRKNHALIVFKERMWLIGGEGPDGGLADVWWSVTGDYWVNATKEAAFGKNRAPQAFTYDGMMWVAERDEKGMVRLWHAK